MVPDQEKVLLQLKKTILEAPYKQRLKCLQDVVRLWIIVAKNPKIAFRQFLYSIIGLDPLIAYQTAYFLGVNNYVENLDFKYDLNMGSDPIAIAIEAELRNAINSYLKQLVVKKHISAEMADKLYTELFTRTFYPEDEFGICSTISSTDMDLTLATICNFVNFLTKNGGTLPPIASIVGSDLYISPEDINSDICICYYFNNVPFLLKDEIIDLPIEEIAFKYRPNLVDKIEQDAEKNEALNKLNGIVLAYFLKTNYSLIS